LIADIAQIVIMETNSLYLPYLAHLKKITSIAKMYFS